ncbi:MAG TPA: ATP-binding cassette domain-containing protein [Planctomycetota bacterium]
MPAALDVQRVVKAYGAKTAVDGVSLSVEPGEIFGLLGPNGAGKTSLIRMVLDIIHPDAGRIHVLGGPLTPAVKDRIAYLPEERGLYQRQKVGDVLRYLCELKGLTRHVAERRVEAGLDRVGLLETKKKNMRELSKGMQQKVQIAAVFLHEPDFVVLDEPFEGLDPVNRVLVTDLMKERAAKGTSIVLSSHRMDQVETLCRRVFLINGGKEVLHGAVDDLKKQFADNAVELEADRDVAKHPMVERAEGRKLWLKEPAEKFLAALIAEGATIRRFEHALPSLDEIFVKVVKP